MTHPLAKQAVVSASSQVGQVYPLPSHEPAFSPPAYRDNLDHLQALEMEARLILALGAISRHGLNGCVKEEIIRALVGIDKDPAATTRESVKKQLEDLCRELAEREEATERSGIPLQFKRFCKSYGLAAFDRSVVLLLFMLATSPNFNERFLGCGFEISKYLDKYVDIGTILSIVCPDYGDQLVHLSNFSLGSPLIDQDILYFPNTRYENNNLLYRAIFINERHIHQILGDDLNYFNIFKFIKMEWSRTKLEQVVLPEGLQDEVRLHVGRYLRNRDKGELENLDEFFGYGTALTLLFFGPSGTGKTMLASGLAHDFNRRIFTLQVPEMSNTSIADEEILELLFGEAAKKGGIVFLDEADDLLKNDSQLSRAFLIAIEKAHCVVILATNKAVALDPAMERRINLKVPFKLPDADLRLRIWQALLPPTVRLAGDVDLKSFSEKYLFTGGQIKNSLLSAINASVAEPKDKCIVITREALEHAASRQAQSIYDSDWLCRIYQPNEAIDDLPVPKIQKEQLRNAVTAYGRLKEKGSGLKILLSTSGMEIGAQAARALASAYNLGVREFDFERVCFATENMDVLDPVTQRKVPPIQYAFSNILGYPSVLLFVDNHGIFEKNIDIDLTNHTSLVMRDFLGRLRDYQGLFCLVVPPLKKVRIPREFDLHFVLDCPPEEVQIRRWEEHFGKEQYSDDDLASLVELHPMHVSEIDFIVRQATIQSFIRGGDGRPTIDGIKAALGRFRPNGDAPILFGAR